MSPEQELTILSPDALIDLFEIELGPSADNTIIYFSNSRSETPISLASKIYTPWPIAVSKYGSSSDGPLPAPTVTLGNQDGIVSSLLDLYDPKGATFRRRRILRKYLDDGSMPRASAQFRPDEFFVDRWDENPPLTVILYLETALAYLSKEVPARRLIDLRSGE